MLPKICNTHLELLYEYLKTNNIAGVEAVEHTLSNSEECVACAYAIKAGGAGKAELINYLSGQGFFPKEAGASQGKTVPLWFGGLIVSLPIPFLGFFLIKPHTGLPVSIVSAVVLFTVAFLFFKPFGRRRFFR